MCWSLLLSLNTRQSESRKEGTPTTSLKSTYLQSNLEAPPLPYHRCSLLESRPTWKRLWTCLELARQYNSMCTCASQMYQACIQGHLRKVLCHIRPGPNLLNQCWDPRLLGRASREKHPGNGERLVAQLCDWSLVQVMNLSLKQLVYDISCVCVCMLGWITQPYVVLRPVSGIWASQSTKAWKKI